MQHNDGIHETDFDLPPPRIAPVAPVDKLPQAPKPKATQSPKPKDVLKHVPTVADLHVNDAMAKRDQLEQELLDSLDRQERLESQLKKSADSESKLRLEYEKLKQDHDHTVEQSNQFLKEIQQSETRIKHLEKLVDELQEKLPDSQSSRPNSAEFEDLNGRIHQLEQENRSLAAETHQIASMEEEIAGLRETVESLHVELDRVSEEAKKTDQMGIDLEDTRYDLQKAHEENSALRSELESIKANQIELEGQRSANIDAASELEDLKLEREDLIAEITDLKDDLKRAIEEGAKMQDALKASKKKLSEVEDEWESRMQTVQREFAKILDIKDEELEHMKKQINPVDSDDEEDVAGDVDVEEIRKQVSSSSIQGLRRHLKRLLSVFDETKKQLNTLEEQSKSVVEENATMKSDLEYVHSVLEQDRQSATESIAAWESWAGEVEQSHAAEIEKREKEITSLREQLTQTGTDISLNDHNGKSRKVMQEMIDQTEAHLEAIKEIAMKLQ